jgi:hypothetical protein
MGYLASLDVKLDDDQYRRLEEVSRIDLGQPHNQLATQATAALGGDASGFTPPRAPRA